jgi:hypothetical protein
LQIDGSLSKVVFKQLVEDDISSKI